VKDALSLEKSKVSREIWIGRNSSASLTFPKSLTGAAENDLMAFAFMAAFAGILMVDRIMMLICSV
jgi:hypothetical protein